MSNHVNEQIIEGLADEFYDDPKEAIRWLEDVEHMHLGGLCEDEILDLYVQCSLARMGD